MRVRPMFAATLGAVTALALLVPTSAGAASPHLRGRVVNTADVPVPGICVDVHPADTLTEKYTVVTNDDGRWAFTRSDAPAGIFDGGRYDVKVGFRDCDGASQGNLASEWHANARSFDTARVVTVDPGAAEPIRINAELEAGAAIRGRVVDDGGAAVGGACVSATDPSDPSVGNSTVAAGDGGFRVVGLPPGTYVLRARDCTAPITRASAYLGPGGTIARGTDDAARIDLDRGESDGVGAVTLPDAAALRGTIGNGDQACVTAVDTEASTTVGDVTDGAGAWRVGGLLPGSWLLKVADCLEDDPARQFATVWLLPGGGTTTDPAVAARFPWVIGSGTTTVGTREVEAGGAMAGRVLRDGTTPGLRPGEVTGTFPGACVSATPRDSLRIVGTDVADGDGRWVIGGLHPDQPYRFAAYDCDADNAHGLDWATSSPVEGQGTALTLTAGRVNGGVDVVVGDPVRRVAGQTRVDTAVRLALDGFERSTFVVLARADAYPDALAGAPLARLLEAPILLTDPSSLSPGVASAVAALGADEVVMLGGTAALSDRVQEQVTAISGVDTVRRVGGQTRFDTAAIIAGFVGGEHAYVVEGASPDPNRGWPDAVSVAGLAARTQAPLLLVERDRVPDGTRTALEELNFSSLTAIGGPVAISEAVEGQLADLTDRFDRLFGETRYGTSAAVVERALELGMWSRTMWLATGQNYPDALVAGALLGQDGGVLQLVAGSDVTASPEALATLADLEVGIDRTVLLGGPVAISEASQDRIAAVLGDG